MKTRVQTPRHGLSAAAVATTLAVGVCLAAAGFEPAPSLKARDLLPASLVKGPKHEVTEAVRSDGFLTALTVSSPFGTWEAADQEMLELRVQEIYALDRLSEFSTSEVFAAAVARAAEQKAKAVVNVVYDPVGTAKALPGGIARFAKGIGRSVRGTADTMAANKADKGPDTRTSEEKAVDAASAAGGAAENLLISRLLAAGAKEVGGWKALTTSDNEIEAVAGDGRLVLPWSVDYMTWNEGTVPGESPPVKASSTREVWITGVATARAKEELKSRGFALVEKRPLR